MTLERTTIWSKRKISYKFIDIIGFTASTFVSIAIIASVTITFKSRLYNAIASIGTSIKVSSWITTYIRISWKERKRKLNIKTAIKELKSFSLIAFLESMMFSSNLFSCNRNIHFFSKAFHHSNQMYAYSHHCRKMLSNELHQSLSSHSMNAFTVWLKLLETNSLATLCGTMKLQQDLGQEMQQPSLIIWLFGNVTEKLCMMEVVFKFRYDINAVYYNSTIRYIVRFLYSMH